MRWAGKEQFNLLLVGRVPAVLEREGMNRVAR